MKTINNKSVRRAMRSLARLFVALTITCAFFAQATAQTQTPADTQIKNTATATYGDGSGGSYETNSNTVTVIVSKVSGLVITPDVTNGTSNPTVVPGQTNVPFIFTVTNTGNFTDGVRFLANGASVQVASGMATIASAFVDVNGNTVYDAGVDADIADASSDLVSFTQGQSLNVYVYLNINSAAPAGSVINVRLGDADDSAVNGFDNEPVDATTTNEVRTESLASVNGRREARGDRSAIVENDAQLSLSLTAPAGPVPLGSNITYVWQLCNTGLRPATAVTLTNAPAGSKTGVFIFAPTPDRTVLTSPQVFPAGTLYSDSPVTDDPVATAQWYTTPPATVTRIAFNVGNTLGVGSCSANLNQIVTITTTDATNPITNQGNAYANNSINAQISAISPLRTTLLQIEGKVLNGPLNAPGAVNNTNNDDFTNKSVSAGIAGIAPGGSTNLPDIVTFNNTVQNNGNANDTYTMTVQSWPAGATVKVTVNGIQTTAVSNGIATGNAITPMSIAYGGTANYQVEVTLPAGKTVLTGYDTVLRATSSNTNTEWNETIDRLYTGFVELLKDDPPTINNPTPQGGPNDPVPGAIITYVIRYRNVSAAPVGGGVGNVTLTASNVTILEDGAAGTNNWATHTTMVLGPPAGNDPVDSNGGLITDGATAGLPVSPATNSLKDAVGSLGPGQSGTFTFKRMIK